MAKRLSRVEIDRLMAAPTMSIPEAGSVFGLGRNASYDAVRRGELDVIRFGRRQFVPTASVRRKLQIASGDNGIIADPVTTDKK